MDNSIKAPEPVVQVERLSLTYQSDEGEIEAIRDISFSVYEGEIVSVIGPSGCGKSTLLSIASGLLSPTSGHVIISGGGNIGYMLQKDSLFPWRTIRQNVLLGVEICCQDKKDLFAYADELLHTYGLWEFRDSFPAQLSGGMRQRAALIRTLAVRPKLLLLDEAFSALDYQTRLAVSDDISSIIRREKKTALMVTHDISEAVAMSDRVIVLSRRPSVIKSVYDIVFAEGRGTPIQCRERAEFRSYFNSIWRDIDVHI
ncbi:MAG: spermidine/putrescine transporter ATP-binding protein [Oscillospiraceae bacterium]|jgi:NitT/TauT family transport system ATP-binding protein|nr:spermidine/putrescine transporter ATP-binding protein [Oscillospiraceae bacterium]